MIKDGIKYCDKCGKQTWHAVSCVPDPTQCPLCTDCCMGDLKEWLDNRPMLIRNVEVSREELKRMYGES